MPTTSIQFKRHLIFGVVVLIGGLLLRLAAFLGRNSWVPEYASVAVCAAYTIALSALFWMATAWISSLRDIGR